MPDPLEQPALCLVSRLSGVLPSRFDPLPAFRPQPHVCYNDAMIRNLFTLLAVSVLLLSGCSSSKPAPGTANPRALAEAGAKIIDVRTAEEYNSGHLAGAINIPHDQIGEKIAKVTTNKSDPLLIHCRSGKRSAVATATLEAQGFSNVIDLGSLDNARQVTGK